MRAVATLATVLEEALVGADREGMRYVGALDMPAGFYRGRAAYRNTLVDEAVAAGDTDAARRHDAERVRLLRIADAA